MEIEGGDGKVVIVDHGLFAGSRSPDTLPTAQPVEGSANVEVPENVAQSEEAELVWRWLNDSPVRLVGASGYLAFPSRRVKQLTVGRRAAA